MKSMAVVAERAWDVGFREVEIPEPGLGDIVVSTRYSWISNGTEGSFIRGERTQGDTPFVPGDPIPFPHVPGYQSVGIVQEVGPEVNGLAVGDWVFVTVGGVKNMHWTYGGHLGTLVAPASEVYLLPDGLDPIAASGLVLTQVGVNTGSRPALQPGDKAIVLGDGMVGHWTAQTLVARGAEVLLVGRHQDRLDLFAGETLLASSVTEVQEAARQWAPSGIQVIGHTAGPVSWVEALYPCLKRFAHVVSAGFVGTEGAMDVQKLRDKELTLHAVAGWTRPRLLQTLDMLAKGSIQTLPLISHHIPASRASEAYDLILHRREPFLGVVLDWSEQA
ncbi:MAG: alcohol dehydrogenase catalytic domain-containing protein [Fimbriimonas sp.]